MLKKVKSFESSGWTYFNKVYIFWEGHKKFIWRFLVSSKKLGGYFFNFWGLLTIYQLYSHKVSSKNHWTYNECLIQNRKVTDRQILNEIEKLNKSKFGFLGTLYKSLNSNESKIDDNKRGLHKLIILSWLLSSTFSLFSELLSLYYDTFYTVNNCT